MTAPSRTRYALLGLLTIRPMTGYDMRRFIETSIGHFWHESYGNIYPQLKRLLNQGLVAVNEKRQSGRPDRKIYRLTPKGRRELARWHHDPTGPDQFKSEFMLKLFFGNLLPGDVITSQLREFAAVQKKLLETFTQTRREIETAPDDPARRPFWLMNLRRGELVARARLAWAEECLRELKRLYPDTKNPGNTRSISKRGGLKS